MRITLWRSERMCGCRAIAGSGDDGQRWRLSRLPCARQAPRFTHRMWYAIIRAASLNTAAKGGDMHLHGKSDPDTEVCMLETIEHLVMADRSARRSDRKFSAHFVVSSPTELREWLVVAMGVINTMTQWYGMTDAEISTMFESFRNGVKEGK